MGSISMQSAIERFIEKFGKRFEEAFEYLIGYQADRIEDITVEHHIKGTVVLMKDENQVSIDIHDRWSTEEEVYLGKEIDGNLEEEFNLSIKGQPVLSVVASVSDRCDEAYLFFETEGGTLEMPIGYHSHDGSLSGLAKLLLTDEEQAQFK